jgi:hypothetical protein
MAKYRLDFVQTSIVDNYGNVVNLDIKDFIVHSSNYFYPSEDAAEIARIEKSRISTNGYYRVVKC